MVLLFVHAVVAFRNNPFNFFLFSRRFVFRNFSSNWNYPNIQNHKSKCSLALLWFCHNSVVGWKCPWFQFVVEKNTHNIYAMSGWKHVFLFWFAFQFFSNASDETRFVSLETLVSKSVHEKEECISKHQKHLTSQCIALQRFLLNFSHFCFKFPLILLIYRD